MGKMKELFMQKNYPNGDLDFDLEREYLTDGILAQEKAYNEQLKLWQEEEFTNPNINTKIQIGNDNIKRRETSLQEHTDDQQIEISGS